MTKTRQMQAYLSSIKIDGYIMRRVGKRKKYVITFCKSFFLWNSTLWSHWKKTIYVIWYIFVILQLFYLFILYFAHSIQTTLFTFLKNHLPVCNGIYTIFPRDMVYLSCIIMQNCLGTIYFPFFLKCLYFVLIKWCRRFFPGT